MEDGIGSIKELLFFKDRYGSFEALAKELRSHPGFNSIHRTTIMRWIETARNGRIRRRAAAALKILRSGKPNQSRELIVAVPQMTWALPASMLNWLEDLLPARRRFEQSGITLITKDVVGDGEARDMLKDGFVHLAIMSAASARYLPQNCQVVCSIAHGIIDGLSTSKIRSVSDMEGLKFAYPLCSILDRRLIDVAQLCGITLPSPIPCLLQNVESVIKSLRARLIDGVVGWPPYIDMILTEAQKPNLFIPNVHLFPSGLLGYVEIVLAVNMDNADSDIVREYLQALMEAVQFLEMKKGSRLLNKIASIAEVKKDKILATDFFFELNTKTSLKLWELEV